MPTGFSDIIEKHPLTIVIGAVLTAVASTFAVVNYFHVQQTANLKANHKMELATADAKSAELNTTISKLNRQLSSIPSNKPFAPGIPVDTLVNTVDPSKLRPDPGKYERLIGLAPQIFYANIDSDIWTQRKMFEAAHTREFAGINPAKIFSELALSTIEKSSMLKWEAGPDYHIGIRFKEMPDTSFILKPFIMVQFIDSRDNARYLRLLNSVLSPHIARTKDQGLDSIVRLAGILEDGSGLKGQPTPDQEIAIYSSKDMLGHMLFFILNEAHQPLLFGNKSKIIVSNIFNTRGLFFIRLSISEEDILFEDGTEGDLWVTREAYIINHDGGNVVISIYIPAREPAPDEALAQQFDDWISAFRISQY